MVEVKAKKVEQISNTIKICLITDQKQFYSKTTFSVSTKDNNKIN